MKTNRAYEHEKNAGRNWGAQHLLRRRLAWVCQFVAFLTSIDAYSATPLQVLKRTGNEWYEKVYSMAFSPDGKVLAVGSSAPAPAPGRFPGDKPLPEGTIELWDLDSGKLRNTLRQSARTENGDLANRVGALAFSPDGKWLIGSDEPGYTLWEVTTGEQKFKWRKGIIVESLSPGWSPDGKWIALPAMLQPGVASFEVSPDGIAVVEAATGNPKMFYPVEIGYARTARISPNGKLLVTAGHDCTVRVFDLRSMTNVFSDTVQTTMFAAGFSPDGRYLVAGSSWGGVLLIYEVHTDGGKVVIQKKGASSPGSGELHSVEFTPDGKHALCNSSERVQLWDTASWTTFENLGEGYGRLSADGSRIALARESAPNLVEIWAFAQLAKAGPMLPK
jgi:WD40 repeat protein